MGTSLNGLTPANTYQALIKVGNNTNLNTTLKTLSDGAGNDLPMQASTTAINFTGTVSGVASGVSGAIQFSNGSAFASDANNLFWDDANNRLGIGTSTPSTTLQVGGSVRFGTGSVGTSLFWDNTNGRLSIGSSLTPSYPLEVNGQSFFNENIIIANGDGIKFWVDKVRIKPPTTDSLGFYTGTTSGSPSERMRIDSAGNVGVGTNAPTSKLEIIGGSTAGTFSIKIKTSTGTNLLQIRDDGQIQIGNGVGNINTVNGVSDLPQINAYTSIYTGINTKNASARMECDSTTQGFLPPRMTTTQKNAIATPATGLQVFDSTMNATCEYTGTAWRVVSAGAQALAAPTAATTVDLSAGNVVSVALTSSTTFTFTGASVGTYILKLIQGGSGSYTVTWPGTVIWSGGTAPTLTTTVGKLDIVTLVYDGTNYYGNYSLNY